jgi:hypothetical protein
MIPSSLKWNSASYKPILWNHRLRLTQTPRKSDRAKNKNGENSSTLKTKITGKSDKSKRARGGLGPPFSFQISENTPQNIQI